MDRLFRVVLDTNVFISSLKGSRSSPSLEIIMLWKERQLLLLYSTDMLSEYVEKLSEHGMAKEKIIEFVHDVYGLGENINIQYYHLEKYPNDQDDVAFILCAENGGADYVVSYDNHLLVLNGEYHFKICPPLDFLFEYRAKTCFLPV